MDMTISELADKVTALHLVGRLDAPGAEAINARVGAAAAAPGRDIAIDLAGVSFIASMGIRLLISTARSLSQRQRQFVLYGASELVQEVFDDAALGQIITIVATADQARAEIAATR